MNFQDNQKDSVQSLLAQLRASQDGDGSRDTPLPPPRASEQRRTSTGTRTIQNHSGASSRQLNDLLSSLGKTLPKPGTGVGANDTTSQIQRQRQLIAPFGPISTLPPSNQDHIHTKRKRIDDLDLDLEDMSELGFTKSLPIISDLLSDEGFRAEVRRMKIDQDTLERRLWAKREKVKEGHERGTRTDIEIARITGKDISPSKKREWDKKLSTILQEFYKTICLPSIDGLATSHRSRLEQMGVPGLGGDMGDEKVRERVRRIMDVLQSGLDE